MALLREGHDPVLRTGTRLYGRSGSEDFVADVRTYDATLRNLELIGEAATHIPEDIRAAHPEIPWKAIIGARNHLIHGYSGIDNDLIWTMVEDAVPELLPALRRLLESVGEERG